MSFEKRGQVNHRLPTDLDIVGILKKGAFYVDIIMQCLQQNRWLLLKIIQSISLPNHFTCLQWKMADFYFKIASSILSSERISVMPASFNL